jgi:protoporphyrin/coproporphyrin ferrochelatase
MPENDTTAVLLMNYGGPEGPGDCEGYIRNIFMDPDLIPIPGFLRPFIARVAARKRAPFLQQNYESMGMYSPILEQTQAQADALQEELGDGHRCYVGMRYFRPYIADVVESILERGHKKIVLLPLYPQESSTTTGSSNREAARALRAGGFAGEVGEVKSFWSRPDYLDAMAELLQAALERVPEDSGLLFAAHGLPLSVARRDPYPGQVRQTVKAICGRVGRQLPDAVNGLESESVVLGWQSKVGPMKWLEPSVETVLESWSRAGRRHVVLMPVAFVSEHSETLYELDVLYRNTANELGMAFTRIPTLQTHPGLISALAGAVKEVEVGTKD